MPNVHVPDERLKPVKSSPAAVGGLPLPPDLASWLIQERYLRPSPTRHSCSSKDRSCAPVVVIRDSKLETSVTCEVAGKRETHIKPVNVSTIMAAVGDPITNSGCLSLPKPVLVACLIVEAIHRVIG